MASFTLCEKSGTTYLNSSLVERRPEHDQHIHFLSRLKEVDNLVEGVGNVPQHTQRRAVCTWTWVLACHNGLGL